MTHSNRKQFNDELSAALAQLRAEHSLRSRRVLQSHQGVEPMVDGQRFLAFCSNDYLGLASHEAVTEGFAQGLRRYGAGAGSAHLIAGHSQAHHALEEALADWLGRERALLFGSGYQANLAVVSALANSADQLVADKLVHASLIDAALLSGARLRRFPHGHLRRAGELLAAARHEASEDARCLLLTDGVFSMDGDAASLPDLAALAQSYRALLVVDDAHGLGVVGEQGRGCCALQGVGVDEVPVLVGTLGKAFGTAGAFVAGDAPLIEFLINKARPYIYTTAQPPAVATASLAALKIVQEEDWRREHLARLVEGFVDGARRLGFKVLPSDSAVVAVVLGDSKQALDLSDALRERGILIPAIRPPTVPMGAARLRVSFSADHSEAHLQRLLESLAELVDAN